MASKGVICVSEIKKDVRMRLWPTERSWRWLRKTLKPT